MPQLNPLIMLLFRLGFLLLCFLAANFYLTAWQAFNESSTVTSSEVGAITPQDDNSIETSTTPHSKQNDLLSTRMKITWNRFQKAFQETDSKKIFHISSVLSFWLVSCIFGAIFFLWNDFRCALRVAQATAYEGLDEGFNILVDVFVYGFFPYSYEKPLGKPSLIAGILLFLFTYPLLFITLPIRIVCLMLRDTIYIFRLDP